MFWQIWFAVDGREISAKLKGALENEEREKLWQSQKETLAAMEEAEKQNAADS